MIRMQFNQGWKMRYEDMTCGVESAVLISSKKDGWFEISLPCDVRMPLIKQGVIREPAENLHSFDGDWIEEKSWWFQKEFELSSSFSIDHDLFIRFVCLDVEADVFLNGVHLGHHISSFYPFREKINQHLKNGINTILVRVTVGLERYGLKDIWDLKRCTQVKGNKIGIYENRGDRRRSFLRKPQYCFGWDWNPRVSSCGINGDVWMEEIDTLSIDSVHAYTECIQDNEAEIIVDAEVCNTDDFGTKDASICLSILYDNQVVITKTLKDCVLTSGINFIRWKLKVKTPALWWPNGMGKQNLYTARVSVSSEAKEFAYPDVRFGIRTVKLTHERISDAERAFALEINGVKTFCKGANWVPADTIYARITDEKYTALVHEAAEANFNMLRVWGGGIYERDIFYDRCDECGIMVWQDYMFACDIYPDDRDWYVSEVEKEIEYQTKRLRNHPSVVLWCGNNESQSAFSDGYLGMGPKEELPFFGGAKIYNYIAPKMVRILSPEIPYWNGSPYGGSDPKSHNMGDNHQFYNELSLDEINQCQSKFLSEFGQTGPMKKSAYTRCIGKKIDFGSTVWQHHIPYHLLTCTCDTVSYSFRITDRKYKNPG